MVALHPPSRLSAFMASHLPDFFERFGISFCIDGPQLEYFIYQKQSGKDVSCSLTVSYDETAKQITVMTFYPGLNLFPETRFFQRFAFLWSPIILRCFTILSVIAKSFSRPEKMSLTPFIRYSGILISIF